MLAIKQLIQTGRLHARENPLARRIWRTIRGKVLLTALVWGTVYAVLSMGFANSLRGASAWSFASAMPCSPVHELLNPCLYLSIWFIFRAYRTTFLTAGELRAAPLTPSERLWAILLPTAAVAAVLTAAGPLALLMAVAVGGGVGKLTSIAIGALIMITGSMRQAVCFTTIALRVLQASYPNGPDIGKALRGALGVLMLQAVCEFVGGILMIIPVAFWFGSAPSSTSFLGWFGWMGLIGSLILVLQLKTLAKQLRTNIGEAERDLFTTELVEQWEQRQR